MTLPQFVVGQIGRAALRRHCILARRRRLDQAIEALRQTGCPGGLVARLRGAGRAAVVTGAANGSVDILALAGTRCHGRRGSQFDTGDRLDQRSCEFFIDGCFLATTRKLGSQGGNADGKGNPREGTGGGRAMKIRHAEFLEYGQD